MVHTSRLFQKLHGCMVDCMVDCMVNQHNSLGSLETKHVSQNLLKSHETTRKYRSILKESVVALKISLTLSACVSGHGISKSLHGIMVSESR